MNKIDGIKKRWFLNYMVVILVIAIFLEGIFIFGIKNVFYKNINNHLQNEAKITLDFYKKYYDTNLYNINEMAKVFINKSSDKNFELQVINLEGKILATNNKFNNKKYDEVPQKLYYQNSFKRVVNNKVTDEKIMEFYIPIKDNNQKSIGYLKYLTSLSLVDEQINKYIIYSVLILIILMLILSILSLFFTQTIINPIEKIISATKKLADGNYNTRIDQSFDDEFKVLANSINQMAKKIQESEKSKNEFISSITHEIRTPLTSIKGWSETLKTSEKIEDEEVNIGLDIITKETERLSLMVEELLEFSKIEAGNLILEKEKFDFIRLIEEILQIYQGKFSKKNIESKFDYKKKPIIFKGDSNRLKQVIINIVENAYKFSDYNSKIEITLKEETEKIVIEIKDFGKGISKKDLDKVKEKFFKGKSKKSGSGLGLAIASQIIELHNGKLSIDSKLNKGTTVKIIIPKERKE